MATEYTSDLRCPAWSLACILLPLQTHTDLAVASSYKEILYSLLYMTTVIFLLITRIYSTYRWSWGPRAFYLFSPHHFKVNLHSGPPYMIRPQLLLCKYSWYFTCMGPLCKIFHCPRLCPEKQDIRSSVSGILKLTWLLLTPSLGFTLKGRIRILGPNLWFFSSSHSQATSLYIHMSFPLPMCQNISLHCNFLLPVCSPII